MSLFLIAVRHLSVTRKYTPVSARVRWRIAYRRVRRAHTKPAAWNVLLCCYNRSYAEWTVE